MPRNAALAVCLLVLPLAARAASYPINPGYWEVKENWLGLVHQTERVCVEPRNIVKFLAAPCNHIYRCVYPVQQMGGGKIHFEGTWSKRGELYHVRGSGDYSPTRVELGVTGHGHWHVMPVPNVSASIRGAFLGPDCPAGAKHFK